MSDDRASVTVRIAGEEHTIRANAEPAYTRKCARLVDERIQEIRAKAAPLEGHKAAILAALSIADEYFQALAELGRARKEVTARCSGLSRRLREELGRDGDGGQS
jgi:cell division protein ZapA